LAKATATLGDVSKYKGKKLEQKLKDFRRKKNINGTQIFNNFTPAHVARSIDLHCADLELHITNLKCANHNNADDLGEGGRWGVGQATCERQQV
jgi:hypothetical protein